MQKKREFRQLTLNDRIMKEINKKQQAISLRKKGFSYNLITDKIGTLKSTLSAWLKDVPFLTNKEVKNVSKLAH